MSKEKNEKEESKGQSAKEIAEIMAANMEDPDFLHKKELMEDKARKKIVEKRKLREAQQKLDSE